MKYEIVKDVHESFDKDTGKVDKTYFYSVVYGEHRSIWNIITIVLSSFLIFSWIVLSLKYPANIVWWHWMIFIGLCLILWVSVTLYGQTIEDGFSSYTTAKKYIEYLKDKDGE